jgi:hypothetical protein
MYDFSDPEKGRSQIDLRDLTIYRANTRYLMLFIGKQHGVLGSRRVDGSEPGLALTAEAGGE